MIKRNYRINPELDVTNNFKKSSTFNTTEKYPLYENKTNFTYLDNFTKSENQEKDYLFNKYSTYSHKFPNKNIYMNSEKNFNSKFQNFENEYFEEKKNLIDSYGQEKNFERLEIFNRKLINIKNKLEYVSNGKNNFYLYFR